MVKNVSAIFVKDFQNLKSQAVAAVKPWINYPASLAEHYLTYSEKKMYKKLAAR